MGLLGFFRNLCFYDSVLPPKLFKEPTFYLRWLSFVTHEGCLFAAVGLVQKNNVPFVILINYLWPSAVLICSVLLAGQAVTRWWAFILGTLIVILSMAYEILGSLDIDSEMFKQPLDRTAYFLAFVGAIAWGLYSAISRRAGDRAGGSIAIPVFQLTLGLALILTAHPHFAHEWGLKGIENLVLGIYCAILFVSFLCWDIGVRKGNIVILSLCADFIPWLSLISATILLGVKIEYHTIISAICLVFGGLITRLGTLPRKFLATQS